ncbi:hypothetical protein OENI_630002 [Oenococcus oeni]|uniref:hypothetical protein n=1 Tax=Oenococcus oeni TaxID=1247 RepID=UPI0010B13925|nr:hypothetical protein [Oenococcus oeni]SYW03687.1 hypothetical protein OENI_630002 [Oenococcus oeni]
MSESEINLFDEQQFKSTEFNDGDIDDVNASEGQMSLFDDPEDSDSKKNKLTRLTRVYEG